MLFCIMPAGRGGADHRRTSQYLMGFASTNQASDAGWPWANQTTSLIYLLALRV